MYEVFLLCANRTVSLQLVMNVLQWTILSHCIYGVSNRLLFICNLTFLGYDRVLKNVLGVLESPGFFCKQESGNPV